MAKRGDGVRRYGKAADLENATSGYVASGTSQFSRGASSAKAPITSEPIGEATPKPRRSRLDLIRENRRELARVRQKLKTERDPIKIEKLRKSEYIKEFFLFKLEEAQRNDHHASAAEDGKSDARRAPSRKVSEDQTAAVITLPGEDDFYPW
jgi:hypothetical protein